MLGLRLSVPMALGRTGWHQTFPCKFTKSGQKRLQIPGLRGSNSSGLGRPAQVFASSAMRAGRGRSVYGTHISSLCSFLLQHSTCFKGGQITKERRDRFLGERLELLSDACLSVRALSKLVMVCSKNCDYSIA